MIVPSPIHVIKKPSRDYGRKERREKGGGREREGEGGGREREGGKEGVNKLTSSDI